MGPAAGQISNEKRRETFSLIPRQHQKMSLHYPIITAINHMPSKMFNKLLSPWTAKKFTNTTFEKGNS